MYCRSMRDIWGNLLQSGNEQRGPLVQGLTRNNASCHLFISQKVPSKPENQNILFLQCSFICGHRFASYPLLKSWILQLTTYVYCALPSRRVEIVLGRYGRPPQGFIVNCVDREYKEEFSIVAYVGKGMKIDAWHKIAQLWLFPFTKGKSDPVERAGAF